MPRLVRHPDCKDLDRNDLYCMTGGMEPNMIWVQVTETSWVGIYVCPASLGDKEGTSITVHARKDGWSSTFTTDTQHTGVFNEWTTDRPLGSDYKDFFASKEKPKKPSSGKVIYLTPRIPID